MFEPYVPHVFFDLDGVFCEWIGEVLTHRPELVNQQGVNRHPNRSEILLELYEECPDFFYQLKKTEMADKLFALAQKLPCNWGFLSAVGDVYPCLGKAIFDKHKWVSKHYGFDVSRKLICVPRSSTKKLFASKYTFLIDDYHRNVNEWHGEQGMGAKVESEKDFDRLRENLNRFLASHNLPAVEW